MSDLSIDAEAFHSASSRIRSGAEKSRGATQEKVSALHAVCASGNTVIGRLLGEIVQQLEAHLPDYLELAITAYGDALLGIDGEVEEADRELAADQPDVPDLGSALSLVWGAVAPSGVLGWTAAVGAKGLAAAATLSQARFSVGRYTDAWRKVLAWGDQRDLPDSLLRFKRSPVTQFLGRYNGLLKDGARVVDIAGAIEPLQEAFAAAASGDARNTVFDALDAGSHLVNHPLAALDVRIWSEVGRAATNPAIDWSPNGLKQIVTASPSEWGHAIVEGVTSGEGQQAFHDIFGL